MRCIKYILYFSILFSPTFLYAQNPKKYFKTAEEFIENKRYNDAIDLLTKAIDLEPDYEEAYLLRATAYESIENYLNAVEDYKRASVFMNKETDVFYKAGRSYYKLGRYKDALAMLNQALDLKKGNLEALQLKVLTLIELEDYFKALEAAEATVKEKSSAENYYYQGLVSEKLKNIGGAKNDYERALKKDKDYVPAYIALAKLALNDGDIISATDYVEDALTREPKNIDAILVKSEISKANHDYTHAISDLSDAISIDSENADLYFLRGELYRDLKQPQNAIFDFDQVIKLDANNIQAYYQRASANQLIRNKDAAIKDYKKLIELIENNEDNKELLSEAEKKLFELNRENNKPELKLVEPVFIKNTIEIPKNTSEIRIVGRLSDESEISFLKINNIDVPIIEDIDGLGFDFTLFLDDENSISIILGDVYNNILHETYQIIRTEVEPPHIYLIAPYALDNNDIYLPDTSSTIYVEGQIEDESKISSVIIEGITASYRFEDINPTFSASINIANKNKIKISATDNFGNETVEVYRISRETNNILASNPMGKTWVVFIENSNYQNFPKLENAPAEINTMKNSLSNYSIHNFLHKKDLGKHELERFFAIELRDLIRSNKVNSLLIFYAGKSEFIDDKGYWLPLDARQGEKFSYFDINALKASLQGYTKYLSHMLVITDVCTLGSQFYKSSENATTVSPNCDDPEFMKLKSSQVLGLSADEVTTDNLKFVEAFARILIENPDKCLSIEKVFNDVSESLETSDKQKLVLGNITNLENQNGTFFFIRRKKIQGLTQLEE